jgi:RNase H-fold protein (predicted Holliday junction resolvase)
MSKEKVVLAIDPGSGKCGLALVHRDESGQLDLLDRAVVARSDLLDAIARFTAIRPIQMLIIGNGTTSRDIVRTLREKYPGLAILIVDERNTTMNARERYWLFHPRKGWRKLLPSTLQVPPEPVDDFVALILAERVLLTG